MASDISPRLESLRFAMCNAVQLGRHLCDWLCVCMQVCLTYVANNLSQVICTDDYKRLTESCQGMVNEILAAVAVQGNQTVARGTSRNAAAGGGGGAAAAAAHAPAGTPGTVAGRLRARRRDEELRALE